MPCTSCGAPEPMDADEKRRHFLGKPPDGCVSFLRRRVEELEDRLKLLEEN